MLSFLETLQQHTPQDANMEPTLAVLREFCDAVHTHGQAHHSNLNCTTTFEQLTSDIDGRATGWYKVELEACRPDNSCYCRVFIGRVAVPITGYPVIVASQSGQKRCKTEAEFRTALCDGFLSGQTGQHIAYLCRRGDHPLSTTSETL